MWLRSPSKNKRIPKPKRSEDSAAATGHDPITPGPRFRDLKCALRVVELEIRRYEAILQATSERRLGIVPELQKLRTYRAEIFDKLKTLP